MTIINSIGTEYKFPETVAQGDLLYASVANTITPLAKYSTTPNLGYLSNAGTDDAPLWVEFDSVYFTYALGLLAIDVTNIVIDISTNTTGALPTASGGTNQYEYIQTLSDGANISWNTALGAYATVTLAGNRTLNNPSNVVAGGMYKIFVKQDGTGGRTLAFGANFKFPGAIVPTISTGISAVDILEFWAETTTALHLTNCIYNSK